MFKTIKELILASGSPRRKALLSRLGINFAIVVPDVDETLQERETADDYVFRMARTKGEHVAKRFSSAWIVAADTIVIADGRLLTKPRDAEEAVEMLMQLSGREHQVRTGYCLCCLDEQTSVVRSVVSEVCFKPFDSAWARAYVQTGEPMDKAGGYGIQDRGGVLVKSLSGSYTNVVGLPLAEVITLLCQYQVVAPADEWGGKVLSKS